MELDILVKSLIVLVIVCEAVYPIPMLASALNDLAVKVTILVAMIIVAFYDPVLALLMVLFFIVALLSRPKPFKVDPQIEINARAASAAYKGVVSKPHSEDDGAIGEGVHGYIIQRPSCAIQHPVGSHPSLEATPLGWSVDPIAPPTGEEIAAILKKSHISGGALDEEIQSLCAIPNERLVDIQNDLVPGAEITGVDEDTGRAMFDVKTTLL